MLGVAHTGFWWGNNRETDHLEDPGLNVRIILKRIFKGWNEGEWTELIWSKIGTSVGIWKCSNEFSGFIKCGRFLLTAI